MDERYMMMSGPVLAGGGVDGSQSLLWLGRGTSSLVQADLGCYGRWGGDGVGAMTRLLLMGRYGAGLGLVPGRGAGGWGFAALYENNDIGSAAVCRYDTWDRWGSMCTLEGEI